MSTFIILILSSVLIPSIVSASTINEENKVFDGKYYYIEQKEDEIFIRDKETNETITMELLNDNKAIVTDDNGTASTLTRDNTGNIYVDNEIVNSISTSKIAGLNISNATALNSGQYHYFQTTYSNSSIDANLQSIALGIFSFVPYVGWIGTIAGVVEAFRSLGKTVMYTKTDHYYIDGYSRYKYVTYYYSDSNRTKLVRTTTFYKDMW